MLKVSQQALEWVFADEARGARALALLGRLQRLKDTVAATQAATLRGVGVASLGEVRALERRARRLVKAAKALEGTRQDA